MRSSIVIAVLALLMGACGSGKEESTKAEKKNVEARAMGDLKIAFYNQDSLKLHFDYYREQDSIVTKKQLSFQNEVERRTSELQNYLISNDEKARILTGRQ